MSSQRHTGAFIAGSVIGGLVGAAVTLWTTPKSGEEFREAVTGNGGKPTTWTFTASDVAEGPQAQRFSNPVLGFIEKATAPIVGVDLGKLAKDDPEATSKVPIRTSSADARPPAASPVQPNPGGDVIVPEEAATHDDDEGSSAHAATVEDLTNPTPEYAEELSEEHTAETEEAPTGFPNMPSDRRD